MKDRKIQLSESQMPSLWYNIIPDLPAPLPPPLHPKTGLPTSLEDLQPIFPDAVLEQEVSDKLAIIVNSQCIVKECAVVTQVRIRSWVPSNGGREIVDDLATSWPETGHWSRRLRITLVVKERSCSVSELRFGPVAIHRLHAPKVVNVI